MKRIGILDSASWDLRGEEKDEFFRGLAKAGFGRKVIEIVDRSANNNNSQLPSLAQQLLGESVMVIIAPGGPASAIAARNATVGQEEGKRTPVVFTTVTDPVGCGLVTSLPNPGGNLTGTFGYTSELDPIRLEVLNTLVKNRGPFGILINGTRPHPAQQSTSLNAEAMKQERPSAVVQELNPAVDTIQTAFRPFKDGKIVALLVTADPYFNSKQKDVINLARELDVPAIYQWPSFVEAGGLMSYGPSKLEAYGNAGKYAGKILNGALPKELPVLETKDFELVISKTAAAHHNIAVPTRILGRPVRMI